MGTKVTATEKLQMAKLQIDSMSSLRMFNKDFSLSWDFGDNWNNQGTQFETYINQYLFPKLNETALINIDLGNRFDWLAKETKFSGQFSEEYVILDSVPVNMNLSKEEELMLKRNYPKMATKFYGSGQLKKQKFTLNNNDTRLNFLTLGDAVGYALAVYKKKISDINVTEEKEIRAMLVDYATEFTKDKREVTATGIEGIEELSNKTMNALLNLQNNSDKYNETHLASGGAIGRYTTVTKLKDVVILTTDAVKTHLLNTQIANTFQISGLDFTDQIISFDDLGGVFKTTEDITVAETETIEYFKTFGDYQMRIGDIIPTGATITFDVSGLTEFVDKVTEIKPATENFAYIFDVNKINYKRDTQDMLKSFFNGEFNEYQYWLHYYSFKAMSPFFNNIVIGG